MSLFPRFTNSEFAPIFRLLDDYDVHRSSRPSGSSVRAFQPRFDVRELGSSYELHGELPGVEQKDVDIEFSDPSTIVISGRSVHEYESGKPHGGAHKATVEDAPDGENSNHSNKNSSTAVTTTGGEKGVAKKDKDATVWVSERSVGEFHRSFSFPGQIDQDGVKASMKNGILHIVVPKAVPKQGRKIQIE